jgi:hypothetical protein
MSDMTPTMQRTRGTAITMFVLAAAMLAACGYFFYQAYQTAKDDVKLRAVQQPPRAPGQEKEPEREATLADGFNVARGNPWFWWSLLNAVTLAGVGMFFLVKSPSTVSGVDPEQQDQELSRIGLFAALSIIGFFTVVSLALPYTWIKSSELLSRQGWKTSEPWMVVLAYAAGLGAMFVSLLAVKSQERASAGIRRWIYGYNAFLGGLLFLAILGVVNAWFALYGPEASDWTSTNIYSVSPALKRVLRTMDKPVRVYLLMDQDTYVYDDMSNLLKNSKNLTDQLDIIEISPSRSPREVDKLLTQFDVLRDVSGLAEGMLLVQDPNGQQPLKTFVGINDLEESSGGGMRGEAPQRFFKGESAFYAALRDFRVGKQKAVIYFTQNSEEFSVDPAAARGRGAMARTALKLRTRLEQSGYEVKTLDLGERQAADPTKTVDVPNDAMAVIVADPLKMNADRLKVLDTYLKRSKAEGVEAGRLIVLLDPHTGADGKVQPSGMEQFLAEYGVILGQDIVYAVFQSDDFTRLPLRILENIDPDVLESIMGILRRFDVEFTEARSVKIAPSPPGVGYDARPLLIAGGQQVNTAQGRRLLAWSEDRLIPNAQEYVGKILQDRSILQKLPPQPLPVAVSVRGKGTTIPSTNPMQPPQMKPGEPKLLVFGDASFIQDAVVEKQAAGMELLVTSLAWLRGKPELDSGDIPPRERKSYRLNMTADTLNRALYLPLLWLLLAVIATGVGVGILRRR